MSGTAEYKGRGKPEGEGHSSLKMYVQCVMYVLGTGLYISLAPI